MRIPTIPSFIIGTILHEPAKATSYKVREFNRSTVKMAQKYIYIDDDPVRIVLPMPVVVAIGRYFQNFQVEITNMVYFSKGHLVP